MTQKVREFWATWYGKVVLACITGVAVLITVAVMKFPIEDRNHALTRLSAVEQAILDLKQERNVELREWDKWRSRVDATQEYMIKQIDAIATRVGAAQ